MDLVRRNNVRIGGRGASTLFFAHGFGCDRNVWRFIAPTYEDRYRVVTFDLVGSGSSDLSAYDRQKYASLDGHARDVAEIVEAFGQGPSIFVSHSVSAMIGLVADLHANARLAAHVMIAPSPRYINDGAYVGGFELEDITSLLETLEGNYLGWSSEMAPTIMGAPDQPELAVELTNSFCRTDPEIAKQFARVTFLSDHRAELPLLRAPTLLLQCDDDLLAPIAVGEYMKRSLPDASLALIANTGHCPHLSAPRPCMDAMNRFFAERHL